MTREEAINVLENPDVSIGVAARIGQDPEYWRKLKPALDMAISAIRQQDHFREATKKVEPLTNADQIRSMSDDELAQFLNQWGTSTRAWQKNKGETMYWLQMLAEEDDHA